MGDHGSEDSKNRIQITEPSADDNHEQAIHGNRPVEGVEVAVEKYEQDGGGPDADVRLDSPAKKNLFTHRGTKRIEDDMSERRVDAGYQPGKKDTGGFKPGGTHQHEGKHHCSSPEQGSAKQLSAPRGAFCKKFGCVFLLEKIYCR